MNLPYYGGHVLRADHEILMVDYKDEGQAERQLISNRYDASLRANGWTYHDTYGDVITQRTQRRGYVSSDGRKSILIVSRSGERLRVSVVYLSPKRT